MKWLTEWAVTSSALILIMLAVRRLFRDKLSARLKYALWAVVLARLLVPVQVELPAKAADALPLVASNLAPEVDRWEERTIPVFPQEDFNIVGFDRADLHQMEPGEVIATGTSTGYFQRSQDGETVTRYLDLWSPAQIVGAVWGTGAVLMALVLLISNLRFARKLKKRRRVLEGAEAPIPVYAAEGLPSPCLFGLFRPAVYVTPEAADNPDALRHILAHELTHYKHKDHIWSLLRCLALALHWYNPLVWLAVFLSKRDGELACDEGAVARLGEEERIPYGRTLVDMVAARASRPGDLLSCSTAMTAGKKSIQQRVARLVKHPKTVKAALFAAVAVLVLAAVFVFAGRDEAQTGELAIYRGYVERAEEIQHSPSPSSSEYLYRSITDDNLLSQARDILLEIAPLDSGEEPDLTHAIAAPSISTIGGGPNGQEILMTTKYMLLTQGEYTYVVRRWEADGSLQYEAIGKLPATVSPRLTELVRQQGKLERAALFGLDRFRAEVETASSIQLVLPAHSSQTPPVPITDEELLVLAKERLDNFVSLNPDNVVMDWNEKLLSASRIVLSDGERSAVYALLLGADNRTYLFSEDDYNACLASGGGETREIKPFARTKIETNIQGSLTGYVLSQEERSRDPNFFVPMPYAEYQTYTPEFLREKGITRLQGWDGRIEDVKLYTAAYKARDYIQLRYYGDETHYGLWALVMDRETWAVLADQPLEVFTAEWYGERLDGDAMLYDIMDPVMCSARLRPEDVVAVYAGDYAPGQAVDLDIPALKEQLTQSLYHQLDTSYDEERHGQYVLKLQLIDSGEDTCLGHELAEDANRLTLSVGQETDVVCLRKTESSINSEYPHCAFVRNPELYRTIRNLFD